MTFTKTAFRNQLSVLRSCFFSIMLLIQTAHLSDAIMP